VTNITDDRLRETQHNPDACDELSSRSDVYQMAQELLKLREASRWKRVKDRPEGGSQVLGFDVLYEEIHICTYRTNYGRLIPVSGNDDVNIQWWTSLPELLPPMES